MYNFRNLGASGQNITIPDIVNHTWNYFKGKGIKVDPFPRLEIGDLIPNSIEPIAIGVVASKLEQYSVDQIKNKNVVEGISNTLSTELIQSLWNQLLQVQGVSAQEINSISIDNAFDYPQYIHFFLLSDSGPLSGNGRNMLNDKFKKWIKNGIIDALQAMGWDFPEEAGSGNSQPGALEVKDEIFKKVDEIMNNKDLTQYQSPEMAVSGVWPTINSQMFQWGMMRYGPSNMNFIQGFILPQSMERMHKNIESHFNYQRDWELTVEGGKRSKEGKAFRPAGFMDTGDSTGLPIVPIAIAAAAGFLLLRK